MNTTPVVWWPESCDLASERIDFVSGSAGGNDLHVDEPVELHSQIRQITSAPAITHNLYCEQPYCNESGNRVALFRTHDACPTTPAQMLVYDINAYRVGRLAHDVLGIGAGIVATATVPWSGVIFTTQVQNSQMRLMRLDMDRLSSEVLFDWNPALGRGLFTISPDHSFGLASAPTAETNNESQSLLGIFRVDLSNGAHELIHESLHISNPHLQVQMHEDQRILVQENRIDGGVGLYAIDRDGNCRRDFLIGPPYTPSTTGHQCWVGNSNRVLVTLSGSYNDGKRCGSVVEVGDTGMEPRVVFDSPHLWTHISVSRCGRFFVTDCYQLPGVPLLIGSIATGKTATLCHAMTSGGGAQYSHAHAYFTGDTQHIVFNSDRTGLPQVYLATVPEGLLEILDRV